MRVSEWRREGDRKWKRGRRKDRECETGTYRDREWEKGTNRGKVWERDTEGERERGGVRGVEVRRGGGEKEIVKQAEGKRGSSIDREGFHTKHRNSDL